MNRHVDEAIAELARRQRSVFSRAQALALGASPSLVDRRTRAGAWLVVAPGVYMLPGIPRRWPERMWIAHLAAGPESVVSHESAAALHAFVGFPRIAVVLTAPHPRHHRVEGAVVHQISDVAPHHVTTGVFLGDGLRVTTPARTFVDLSTTARMSRLSVALDDAVTRGITTDQRVGACLTELARPGKPAGLARLARLLDDRGPGYVPPASQAERLLHAVIGPPEFPPLVRQAPHPGAGMDGRRTDGTWFDVKLILEADSRSWHARVRAIRRDRERDAAAAAAGFLTLRFLYEQLRDDAEGVRATVREVRAVRLRQLGTARPAPPGSRQ